MAERTTIEGYDIERDFREFTYTKLRTMYHPRIKEKKDGEVRVSGLCNWKDWKGPAWAVLVSQAESADDDLHARFVNDSQGEAKVLVVREGIGLTIEGIAVLRALLSRTERKLFEVGLTMGERHILSLGSGNGPLYPYSEAMQYDAAKNPPI